MLVDIIKIFIDYHKSKTSFKYLKYKNKYNRTNMQNDIMKRIEMKINCTVSKYFMEEKNYEKTVRITLYVNNVNAENLNIFPCLLETYKFIFKYVIIIVFVKDIKNVIKFFSCKILDC